MAMEEQRLSEMLKRTVPEPSAELSAARAMAGQATGRPLRQPRRRWAIPAVAGLAATAAAVAAVIVVPSAVSHPATATAVTYQINPAATEVTASYVLDKAAVALGSRPQIGTTWPAGAYWHTKQESKDTSCPGQVEIANIWTEFDGNGVGERSYSGPKSSSPFCRESTEPYAIVQTAAQPVFIGRKSYSRAQLAALPTDPAKLWPIVRADETLPFSSTDPGALMSGQSDLFHSILSLLASEPVPTPLAQALYEVAAKIPGVTVAGQYTDSLGRTGTLLRIGDYSMAIDTSNGQVLFSTDTITREDLPPTRNTQVNYGTWTTVYISSGWAAPSSVPKVSGGNGS